MADFVDAILADNFFEASNDVRWGWIFFFFITKQILLHNFALPDFISNDFIFQAYFLKHFGWIWPILLMRFWQIIFLKGQTTSDGAEFFFSLLNRYFSTTLLYQILFLRQYVTSSFFKHIFLSILATFWLILLMRFWQIIFLKGQMTSDRAEIFFHY